MEEDKKIAIRVNSRNFVVDNSQKKNVCAVLK